MTQALAHTLHGIVNVKDQCNYYDSWSDRLFLIKLACNVLTRIAIEYPKVFFSPHPPTHPKQNLQSGAEKNLGALLVGCLACCKQVVLLIYSRSVSASDAVPRLRARRCVLSPWS